jgi:AcrR family transcriptional regulator
MRAGAGRPGRPSRDEAARLAARVLSAARDLFLRDGYASTSMEAVAAAAMVSKRTLYRYHPDKPALLHAVIAELIAGWRPPFDAEKVAPEDLPGSLFRLARRMLQVALMPEALALHRLAVSEAARFPEIGRALHQAGVASGADRIAELLSGVCAPADAVWHAGQFQNLVIAGPQSRAIILGEVLAPAGQEAWARHSVALFLHGVTGQGG